MSPERPEGREEEVFALFMAARKLSPPAEAVARRPPPEPLILCRLPEGAVAYELVEILAEDAARRMNEQIHLERIYRLAYQALPPDARAHLERRFGNCHILVAYREEARLPEKEKAVTAVLRLLASGGRLEDSRGPDGSSLAEVVRQVVPVHGDHAGPDFGVQAGGSFRDPVAEVLARKLSGKYGAAGPAELLAYYYPQPLLPDHLWLPSLETLVELRLSRSPFRRVWVFDAAAGRISYVRPGPTP